MHQRSVLALTVLLMVWVGACKDKETQPPEPPIVPSTHFVGTLRLSVAGNDEGHDVYFYVRDTFKGHGYVPDISLEPGNYVVYAVIPSETNEAAFHKVTKQVEITAGEIKEVRFDIPDIPQPSFQLIAERAYVPYDCSNGHAFVEESKTIRAQVAADLRNAQYDSLYTDLFSLYNAIQRQPPQSDRLIVQNVPVIDSDSGSSGNISLELVPSQIRHLASWLDNKYDFAEMQRKVETAATHLDTIVRAAESCVNQSLYNAAIVEKGYEDGVVFQVKEFRKQFEAVTTGLANKLEEAGHSSGNR